MYFSVCLFLNLVTGLIEAGPCEALLYTAVRHGETVSRNRWMSLRGSRVTRQAAPNAAWVQIVARHPVQGAE